jgi:5'-deoxynucleotidase YfbR-like HD superfamily hydrolase
MRVSMIALLLPNTYDISKCIQIGLIHDIAESIVGDIIPS